MKSKENKMTVWISKYALTTGILKMEAKLCSAILPDRTMIQIVNVPCPTFYHKPDWHETKKEAVAKAEEMRKKQIESLQHKIDKLKLLKFA